MRLNERRAEFEHVSKVSLTRLGYNLDRSNMHQHLNTTGYTQHVGDIAACCDVEECVLSSAGALGRFRQRFRSSDVGASAVDYNSVYDTSQFARLSRLLTDVHSGCWLKCSNIRDPVQGPLEHE